MADLKIDPDSIRWEVPISGLPTVPMGVPEHWATALRAVSHDMAEMQHGRHLDPRSLVWDLEFRADGSAVVGLHESTPTESRSSFERSQGYTSVAPASQCIVWVAEAVQDYLAGYEFVQWPSNGGAPYRAQLIAGIAVWSDLTGTAIVPIGKLNLPDS